MRISDWSSDVCSSDLGEDVLPGRKGGCLGSLAVVISQAALVAAQPFRKPIGCSVEGGIGFICLPMSFQLNAAAYMRGNHGTIQMSVPRKRYRHLQRIPEVLPENPRKAFVYVRSQRVTDVQLLSITGELHHHFSGLKRGGLPPFQHAL